MIFQNLILAAATSITLIACGSTESKPSSTKEQVAQSTKEESPATENFVNGLTEANKGVVKGNMELSGSFRSNVNNATMYLYETEGKQHFVIDSTQVNASKFAFETREYESGFYMLGLNNAQNLVAIIMNPAEKAVEVAFNTGRLESSISSPTSKENTGWFEYIKAEKAAEEKKKSYRKSAKDSPMKAKFEKLQKDEDDKLKALQQDLIGRYPGTYLAKLMSWKQTPHKTDKSKYWSDLDFEDESLIHAPIVPDRIQDFMRSFSGGTDNGFMNAIDLVAQAAAVKEEIDGEDVVQNERVYSFTILTMLEGFYSSGKEDMCSYIMDSYVYGENCGSGDFVEEMQNRAKGIKNLALGSVPPDFTIEKSTGGTLNLQKEVEKHEYTLVMFWSSWCHKCEQEIPTLKVLHDQYKDKGFGVVGVSVDQQRNAWLNAIESKGASNWPNVSQLQAWDSPVAKEYRVSQTPTLFLLNSDREIVLKPQRIFHVRDFLSKNLK